MASTRTIEFADKGIGQALHEKAMHVPLNQREYAWEEKQVGDLFRDLSDAKSRDGEEYFLGMIVVTPDAKGTPLIVDGQQRLATISIFLAAIRDYLVSIAEPAEARKVNDKFLQTSEFLAKESEPKLRLNVADDEYFRRRVLSDSDSPDRAYPATKPSHNLINEAAELAADQVRKMVATLSQQRQLETLISWVYLIQDRARVILVTAADEGRAYGMFETLNDRGVKAAQSDLVKNYLLGKSGDRIQQVHARWAEMVGALEQIDDEKIVVTYLRHYYVTQYGHVREHELFESISGKAQSSGAAIDFTNAVSAAVDDYVALRLPDHPKWKPYGTSTRQHIKALDKLKVEQIRPLMFAVAQQFSIPEAREAFRLFVSWSIRLLVGGGSRLGRIDKEYAARAFAVGTRRTTTAQELAASMAEIVPGDNEFEENFAIASIHRGDLARYVLRSLELRHLGHKEPEHIPNDDEKVITLEHVLPVRPSPHWNVDAELASNLHRRIGNLALLQWTANTSIGNGSFADKAKSFKQSNFPLTAEIGSYEDWNATTIAERQKRLAKIAVETWPITVASAKKASARKRASRQALP